MNKDNQITVSEFKQYVRSTVSKNNAALIFGGAINIFAIILFMSIAYFLIIK
jgi:hypothetical protein